MNGRRAIPEICRTLLALSAVVALGSHLAAQGRAGGPPAQEAADARTSAPIDLTGTWVAIVNEDWRWRMITPPAGDYPGLPLTPQARKVADSWDASQDGRCEAFGAAGLMRMPTRLNISWENPTTLKIETDAGRQTRRLLFDAPQPPSGPRTLQGHSVAEWERAGGGRGGRGGAAAPPGGSLKVVTTHMSGGWLRRNGVPYSEAAVLTEHFDRFAAPDGSEWLVVTSIVSDPQYLTADYVTSSHFRREPDASKFSPTPCRDS